MLATRYPDLDNGFGYIYIRVILKVNMGKNCFDLLDVLVMEMIREEIDLPRSITALIKVEKNDLCSFIKRSLAVELYRERKLSLGKAAEVAGVRNKWEMLMLLNERGVPIDYSAADAQKDLKTLKEVLGR